MRFMSNVNFRKEKIKNKGFKYNIFNVMFLFCFFVFAVVGGKIITAAEKVTVHQSNHQGNNSDNSKSGYTQITMEEAKDIFEEKGDYIILDEFATAHL